MKNNVFILSIFFQFYQILSNFIQFFSFFIAPVKSLIQSLLHLCFNFYFLDLPYNSFLSKSHFYTKYCPFTCADGQLKICTAKKIFVNTFASLYSLFVESFTRLTKSCWQRGLLSARFPSSVGLICKKKRICKFMFARMKLNIKFQTLFRNISGNT